MLPVDRTPTYRLRTYLKHAQSAIGPIRPWVSIARDPIISGMGQDRNGSIFVPENITDPLQTLPVYTNVFSKIGLVTLGVTVVMALMVPWLNRMINTPASAE